MIAIRNDYKKSKNSKTRLTLVGRISQSYNIYLKTYKNKKIFEDDFNRYLQKIKYSINSDPNRK